MGTVTTVGRTLDRNLSSVDEILQNGNNLFQGAERAYDPTYNWLNLNLATSPGVTGAYVAGLLRDRLAGICRRIVANHSTGLSAAVIATLNQCGNPSSGFFDPLLNDIPTILDTLNGGSRLRHRPVAPAAGTDADRQRRAGRQGGSDDALLAHAGTEGTGVDTTTTTTVPKPTTTTTTTCGLLGAVLGCSGSSGSSVRVRARRAARPARGSAACCRIRPREIRASPPPRWPSPAPSHAQGRPDAHRPAASLLPPLPQDQAPPRARAPWPPVGLGARRGGVVLMRAPS